MRRRNPTWPEIVEPSAGGLRFFQESESRRPGLRPDVPIAETRRLAGSPLITLDLQGVVSNQLGVEAILAGSRGSEFRPCHRVPRLGRQAGTFRPNRPHYRPWP